MFKPKSFWWKGQINSLITHIKGQPKRKSLLGLKRTRVEEEKLSIEVVEKFC